MRPFDDIVRLERAQALDKPAAAVRGVVQRLPGNRSVADALHGVWLGHPLHPGLAQFTLGSFVSATVLDAVGGGRRESTGLIALGLALTAPTVAAGWADWSEGHEEQQRVGLVHAALNGTAVACYAGVLVARARGGRGTALSLLGGALSSTGALLGGHLSLRMALGANHAEDVAHLGPEDWQRLGPLAEVPEGEPVRRVAGAVPVLVVRRGADVAVLADRCPHLSAPLSDGELTAEGTVLCPWHGSEFRLSDGCVVHGPATAPVPRFEARVAGGELEARVVTIPGVPAG